MSKAMRFFACFMMVTLALPGLAQVSAQGGQTSALAQPAAESTASKAPQHNLDFPFFQNSDGFRSTLMLNNNSTGVLSVAITAYNAQGEVYQLQTRTISNNSPLFMDLEEELSSAPKSFGMGNLRCRYSGAADLLTGQVSVVNAAARISFEATMAMGGMTSRLASAVSVLSKRTDGFVALTNLGDRELKVSYGGDIRDAVSSDKKDGAAIRLAPRATKVLAIETLAKIAPGRPALIAFKHDGTPGDLTAIGVVFDKSGFSSTLYFVDPGEGASNTLAGAHFYSGTASRNRGFPSDTRFRSVFTLANTSISSAQALVSVDYTVGNRANHIQVAAPVLAAGDALDLDLTERLHAFGVDDVDDAGVDVFYTGSPGALIGKLTSVDQAGDLVFDTPIKDPSAGMYRSSGSHPWRLDGSFNTTIALKNVLAKAVDAMVVLRYKGGQYSLPRVALEPFQTVSINLREVMAAGKKDLDGNSPPRASTGKVLWFQEEPDSLIGRAEIYDTQTGIAGSFSCFYPCGCTHPYYTPNTTDTWVTPNPFTIPYLGTQLITTNQRRSDCFGTNLGTFDITSSTIFTSSNSSIFSFTGNTIHAVGVGSTTYQGQAPRNIVQPPVCPVQSQANPGGYGTATPQCFAQLKYRPVTFIGVPVGNHSFWWIRNSIETQYVTDAGPSGTCPLCGFLVDWVVPGTVGHYAEDNSGASLAWSSGVSAAVCTGVTGLYNYAVAWPQTSTSYNALGAPNSNTWAHSAAIAAPFAPTAPPNAPGW